MEGRSRWRHAVEYALFRLLRWTWSVLPEGMAARSAAALGLVAATVLRVRRRAVDEHLAIAFPDRPRAWRDRVARACYVHLAREGATLVRMQRWSAAELSRRVVFDGLEDLRRSAGDDHGAVLLTGHLGNWELAGSAIAASGVPLDVVGKGMANRRFEADLFALRARLGMQVVDMEEAPRGVLRGLREGRVVAMLADQNAHKSDLFLPFFGKLAATVRGPATFAARTGAPVFFGVALREGGWRARYRIRLRPMEVTRTGDSEADTRRFMAAYGAALEAAIREAPEQYFWHHKRWRTRPSEEPSHPG